MTGNHSSRVVMLVGGIAFVLLARVDVSAQAPCVGDCDEDGTVAINEVVNSVNIFLENSPVSSCTNADQNGDGGVPINEVVGAVNSFLDASTCPRVDVPAAACGNGVVDQGEDCDLGSVCWGGDNNGAACTSAADCGEGIHCMPAGGKGCAVNCTTETVVHYEFTGALCLGGAKDGTACNFLGSCTNAGALNGKPCLNSSECGSGTCVSECGADSKGCFGDGECVAGTVGEDCWLNSAGQALGTCSGGSSNGNDCFGSLDCPGGSCAHPCGTGGSCLNKSRSALQSLLTEIPIGPMVGFQTHYYGKPSGDGTIPVAMPAGDAGGSFFEPVKVPGVLCACVRGNENAPAHGPGNSASGVIDCGAGTIKNNVTLASDHNTNTPGLCVRGTNKGQACTSDIQCGASPPTIESCNKASGTGKGNGAGTCEGGTVAGRACVTSAHCLGGGTCAGLRSGGGICMGTPKFCAGGTSDGAACFNDAECPGGTCPGTGNYLGACKTDADCPGSLCVSPDDPTCTQEEPPLPEGSGAKACLVEEVVCTAGENNGEPCSQDLDCGTGGRCATTCASTSPNSSVGYCISPNHLTFSGSGGLGGGLLLSTTAIGTISDGGKCNKAAKCIGGNGAATCVINADCAGGTCVTATCSNNATKGCLSDAECPGGTCVGVDPNKGPDGIPCTDDDPQGSRGQNQTIPTTTGVSSAMVSDANRDPGSVILHHRCSSGTGAGCNAKLVGAPFSCAELQKANPSVAGVRMATSFPALDQTVGDSVVSTFLSAK